MIFTIHSCIDSVALTLFEKETSIHKVVEWLTRHGRFAEIILKGFTKELWIKLIDQCSLLLCKDRRKRKTSREQIEQEISFIDTNNQVVEEELVMIA